MIKERIRLAEAMGWYWQGTVDQPNNPNGQWCSPDIGWMARGEKHENLPDPFTDANDDYAVLEWMREKGYSHPDLDHPMETYCIGNFAKAAMARLLTRREHVD